MTIENLSPTLPHFIIAGATRCGTTSLHSALAKHSGIFVPPEKEIKFFYEDAHYGQGLEHYQRYFTQAKAGQVIGEVCPLYFEKDLTLNQSGIQYRENYDSATRIKKYLPNVQLFFSLRDPISRAHSMFWKNKWQGRETAESFEQAIEEELNGQRQPEQNALCYLWRNHYQIHLQRWLDLFDAAQIHCVVFEEWTQNPQIFIDRFRRVMGVEPWSAETFEKQNQGRSLKQNPLSGLIENLPLAKESKWRRRLLNRLATDQGYPALAHQTRHQLKAVFAQDQHFLEERLGRSIILW